MFPLHAPRSTFHASSGFTIIETLVALVILVMAITVPLTLAEKGLASAEAAKEEITALFLAQEAMEYIKNRRDENAIASGERTGQDWLHGLEDCFEEEGCGIDSTASEGAQVFKCDAGNSDCLLERYKEDLPPGKKGIFGHPKNRKENGWMATVFHRKVTIEKIEGEKEAKVVVAVRWDTKGLGGRNVTVKSNMLNWYHQ